MLMVLILQSKDIDWWAGFKSKTQPFVAYKKCVSWAKTNIGLR
jgi:hypothetical protein